MSDTGAKRGLAKTLTKATRDSNPVLLMGSKFGQLADKVYMSPEHCYLYLARRVGEARRAQQRGGWFGGRLMNRMQGSDPARVPLSGAVMEGVLQCLGEEVPQSLERGGDYQVPLEKAEAWLEGMSDHARAQGWHE